MMCRCCALWVAWLVAIVRCNQVSLPLAESPTFEENFWGFMAGSSYFVAVEVGTPPQNFELAIDSGSAAIWLAEPVASQPSAFTKGLAPTFDPKSSSPFVDFNATADLIYGVGQVEGTWGADAVTVGSLSVKKQALVAANHVIQLQQMGSGMIGFSPDGALRHWGECSGAAVNMVPCANVTTFAQSLLNAGSLDRPVVTIALDAVHSCTLSIADQISCMEFRRSTLGGKGSITIGGLAPGTHDGDYMWMPRSDDNFWVAALNMTFSGGNKSSIPMRQPRVLFDTGTSGVLLTLSAVERLVESWALEGFNTSTARFSCKTKKDRRNLSFDLNVDEKRISIPADFFMVCSDDCGASGSFCHLPGFGYPDRERDILHNPEFGNYNAILGVPFLRALKAFAFDYTGSIGIVAPDSLPTDSAATVSGLFGFGNALLIAMACALLL